MTNKLLVILSIFFLSLLILPENQAIVCGTNECESAGKFVCGSGFQTYDMCCTGRGCPSYTCIEYGGYDYIKLDGAHLCCKDASYESYPSNYTRSQASAACSTYLATLKGSFPSARCYLDGDAGEYLCSCREICVAADKVNDDDSCTACTGEDVNVCSGAPSGVANVTPADGATNVPYTAVPFSWTLSSWGGSDGCGTRGQVLEVSCVTEGVTAYWTFSIPEADRSKTVSLPSNSTCTWRVSASNSAGTARSPFWSFSTTVLTPPTANITGPTVGSGTNTYNLSEVCMRPGSSYTFNSSAADVNSDLTSMLLGTRKWDGSSYSIYTHRNSTVCGASAASCTGNPFTWTPAQSDIGLYQIYPLAYSNSSTSSTGTKFERCAGNPSANDAAWQSSYNYADCGRSNGQTDNMNVCVDYPPQGFFTTDISGATNLPTSSRTINVTKGQTKPLYIRGNDGGSNLAEVTLLRVPAASPNTLSLIETVATYSCSGSDCVKTYNLTPTDTVSTSWYYYTAVKDINGPSKGGYCSGHPMNDAYDAYPRKYDATGKVYDCQWGNGALTDLITVNVCAPKAPGAPANLLPNTDDVTPSTTGKVTLSWGQATPGEDCAGGGTLYDVYMTTVGTRLTPFDEASCAGLPSVEIDDTPICSNRTDSDRTCEVPVLNGYNHCFIVKAKSGALSANSVATKFRVKDDLADQKWITNVGGDMYVGNDIIYSFPTSAGSASTEPEPVVGWEEVRLGFDKDERNTSGIFSQANIDLDGASEDCTAGDYACISESNIWVKKSMFEKTWPASLNTLNFELGTAITSCSNALNSMSEGSIYHIDNDCLMQDQNIIDGTDYNLSDSGSNYGIAVLYVDGDVTFSDNVTSADNTEGIIFVVNGDVTFESNDNYGYPSSSVLSQPTLSNIKDGTQEANFEGALMATGNISFNTNGTEDDNSLIIRGSVMAKGSINHYRNRGDLLSSTGGNVYPSIVYVYDPMYMAALTLRDRNTANDPSGLTEFKIDWLGVK